MAPHKKHKNKVQYVLEAKVAKVIAMQDNNEKTIIVRGKNGRNDA